MLHKGYDRKCSVDKKDGRESQGACSQDKLICGESVSDCSNAESGHSGTTQFTLRQ
jgi:hypothetical protein